MISSLWQSHLAKAKGSLRLAPSSKAPFFSIVTAGWPERNNSPRLLNKPVDQTEIVFALRADQGEILNEEQFFARYPNADGRYIAGLTDNYYIDGTIGLV